MYFKRQTSHLLIFLLLPLFSYAAENTLTNNTDIGEKITIQESLETNHIKEESFKSWKRDLFFTLFGIVIGSVLGAYLNAKWGYIYNIKLIKYKHDLDTKNQIYRLRLDLISNLLTLIYQFDLVNLQDKIETVLFYLIKPTSLNSLESYGYIVSNQSAPVPQVLSTKLESIKYKVISYQELWEDKHKRRGPFESKEILNMLKLYIPLAKDHLSLLYMIDIHLKFTKEKSFESAIGGKETLYKFTNILKDQARKLKDSENN